MYILNFFICPLINYDTIHAVHKKTYKMLLLVKVLFELTLYSSCSTDEVFLQERNTSSLLVAVGDHDCMNIVRAIIRP